MDTDRARELLNAERERIERALGGLEHEDDSEPADEFDPANLGADLYQDELDEGLQDDLRSSSPPSSARRHGSRPGRTASRSRAASRSPTSASRRSRPPS